MVITMPGSTLTKYDGLQGPTQHGSGQQTLRTINVLNGSDVPVFIQCFNKATIAAVNLGTTVPDDIIPVPPADWSSPGPSVNPGIANVPYAFGAPLFPAGLVIAATRSPKGNDLAFAGDVFVSIKSVAT